MPGRERVFPVFKKIFPGRVRNCPRRRGVSPRVRPQGKGGEDIDIPWETAAAAGAALSGLLLLLTTYNRVYRWTLRQREQDEELRAIRKENTLLTYGVLACLKGLEEQGCDGPVHEAIDRIEKDLNLRAHDQ